MTHAVGNGAEWVELGVFVLAFIVAPLALRAVGRLRSAWVGRRGGRWR